LKNGSIKGSLAILGTSNCRLSTPSPPEFWDLVILGISNCRLPPPPPFWDPLPGYPWDLQLSLSPWFGDLEIVGTSDCRLPRPPDFWDLAIIGTSKFVVFPLIFGIGHPAILGTSNCRISPPGYFWDLARLPILSLWNRVFLFFQFRDVA